MMCFVINTRGPASYFPNSSLRLRGLLASSIFFAMESTFIEAFFHQHSTSVPVLPLGRCYAKNIKEHCTVSSIFIDVSYYRIGRPHESEAGVESIHAAAGR